MATFSILRSVGVVSGAILLSRILGLLRDSLFFAFFGSSRWGAAFLLAFTLPNLWRRLFGEGALTSAYLPLFSEVRAQDGLSSGFVFLNHILSRMLKGLGLIALLLMIGSAMVGFFGELWFAERWSLSGYFGSIMMPYLIFLSIAAILSATLNHLEIFKVTSLSSLCLNICLIFGLVLSYSLDLSPLHGALILTILVVLAGALQLYFPMQRLKKEGWQWHYERGFHPRMREVYYLLLPGIFSAAVAQVNVLISRLLAFSLDDRATSLLYIANRLVELPLGLFVIGVTTVFFPRLAKQAHDKPQSL